MRTDAIDRRHALSLIAAAAAAGAWPGRAAAMTLAEARALIQVMLADLTGLINSGRSAEQLFPDFERLFNRYGDVPTIAQSALGPPARSASRAQMQAFTQAFSGYLARKYGRRFREFIGGRIEVTGGGPVRSFFEVVSMVTMRGEPPFEVRWHVSDRSGRQLFFNMIIEGVNMLATERTEIGAMLDRRRGDLEAMIADLRRAG
ncbi:MAG: ABC transporter substrate-binding protein [Rhodobacteraceae bacterium]|jgi:phospholipid transport system substrate-binding protein|nr:ABC transporter substrate-binding protein [Paracoccaceae bacterium]